MILEYIKGNILESTAQALVNTVNTVGIMGKGIALQFKRAYPNNFKHYAEACKNDGIGIGKLFVSIDRNLISGEKIIINFPTKKDWKKPSEYEYIELGLNDLIEVIKKYSIKSIAIPPLGAGNGGLNWATVKKMIEDKLSPLDIKVYIYEPTKEIKEYLKNERVKLTDSRAMLLFVLYDLVGQGEFVSEFSSEKVCYFLQKFGAKKYFNLNYEPKYYGPYSGTVKRLLYVLNGSYIMGYSDMNKKPFDPLLLVTDGYKDVVEYIEKNKDLQKICNITTECLSGFYSDFALELLSSVDYIVDKEKTFDKDIIKKKLEEWSKRKTDMFSNSRYIDISLKQIQKLQKYYQMN
ncbi:MAG: macro domain-containing protein [Fusobacteriaceae bacterium]|jgi:O-acetyl-ADP-ribose deacetylase (regulator of RNase III)|nr:macro domain-containing protein [Fusobacteriaceae bacterium]